MKKPTQPLLAAVFVDLAVHPFTTFTWPDRSTDIRHLAIPYGRPVSAWTRDDVIAILRRAARLLPTSSRVETDGVRWAEHDGKLEITLQVGDGNGFGATLTIPGRLTAADVLRLIAIGGGLIFADMEKVILADVDHPQASPRLFDQKTEHEYLPRRQAVDAVGRDRAWDAVRRKARHRRGVAVHLAKANGRREVIGGPRAPIAGRRHRSVQVKGVAADRGKRGGIR
jgi:hypothetical protein